MVSAPSSTHSLFAPVLAAAIHLGVRVSAIFLNTGSTFSLLSLASALMISVTFLLGRRVREGQRLPRVKVVLRALFPGWLWQSPSTRSDIGFFLLNGFATGTLIGWALLSYDAIGRTVAQLLVRTLGPTTPLLASPFWGGVLLTVSLFLAYDFAYWVDHFLKHKVPLFWEFHRVHHTAEVLSPLTAFRMHPVDSLIFFNIVALVMGTVNGVGVHVLGNAVREATLSDTNIILVFFVFATIHLQHSHIDIRFRGWLGRAIFSPAHHHIHHSTRPEHYDCNLGSCLAIWDWLFGTLILPDNIEEPLQFGADVEGDLYRPHSVSGGLLLPFVRVTKLLGRARPTTLTSAQKISTTA